MTRTGRGRRGKDARDNDVDVDAASAHPRRERDAPSSGSSVLAALAAIEQLDGDRDQARDQALRTVVALVLELVHEVEALRTAVAEAEATRAEYARAYWEIALLAHDDAVLDRGTRKLLDRWLGVRNVHVIDAEGGASSRELAMLTRLGLSREKLDFFQRLVQRADDD